MEIEIKARNLSVFYPGEKTKAALRNINIDIPKNSLTAIIGPSGCGKTSLLKTLNRLHEVRGGVRVEGNIFISGEDIYHSNRPVPELRRKVGLVAQKPYPLPASIYENVIFGPKLNHKLNRSQLDEISEKYLKKADLWEEVKDRLDSPAADLSVGQQQRLCIARTLANEPEVILCDEITSALDPISSKKVEELLLSLKQKYTIVLVSHVLRQAKRLADHIIFLYLGEVIETGDAKQFFANPAHDKSKEYIEGVMAGT